MLLSFEEFMRFTPQKPTYALFGYPLGHTMSPELHAELFACNGVDADYIGVSVPAPQLADALARAKKILCGLNLTIPHKQAILPLLDGVDVSARDLNSVNTVAFTQGKSIGYNTDILGFKASVEQDGIALASRKVLLLGYGGAAAVMGYHCASAGAQVIISGRNIEKASALAARLCAVLPNSRVTAVAKRRIPRDITVVINGTPLGMFPKEEACPLRFLPRKTEYVFDAIYNPPLTALMRLAGRRRIKVRCGLHMLVMQAAHAQTIWTGKTVDEASCESVLRHTAGKLAVKRLHDKYHKENIVLCGFMGSGKTTAGRKLAKLCGLQFIDLDHYLEEQEGLSISEIFAIQGEDYFRDRETFYLRQLTQKTGVVIALGGGAVLRPENIKLVKQSGLLIHLDTPFYRILKNIAYSDARPLLEQGDKELQTRKLYNARKNIYHAAADCAVRSPRLSDLISRILNAI